MISFKDSIIPFDQGMDYLNSQPTPHSYEIHLNAMKILRIGIQSIYEKNPKEMIEDHVAEIWRVFHNLNRDFAILALLMEIKTLSLTDMNEDDVSKVNRFRDLVNSMKFENL